MELRTLNFVVVGK